MRSGARPAALALLSLATAFTWLGCDGGGGDVTAPTLGTLEVRTATSGPEPDPDGYSVSLDGGAPASVGVNAVLRYADLPAGSHTVELSGFAANCSIAGEPRRTVTVTGDAVATAAFDISCAPTTGALEVTTSTTGPADEDGYRLLLDGADVGPITAAGAATLTGIAPGDHAVALGGVAPTCRVGGDNPSTVTVVAGGTAAVGFSIVCEPPPPVGGTLVIATATTGSSLDPDGYQIRVDGGGIQGIGLNATVTTTGLGAGNHTVELQGIASNCTLAGDNPRSAAVSEGGTVQVTFEITCTTATGTLRVAAGTTGSPADSDGYTVSVDGGPVRNLATGGTLTIEDLAAGSHTVALGDLAENCTAADNPRSVTVAADETTRTEFAVVCSATTGRLAVSITGLPDAVSAALTVTGPGDFSRQVTTTRTLRDLQPGEYTVAAAEVSGGGTRYAPSPASQTASVVAGETARASVAYTAAGTTTLNLRIDGWHLTQGVQTAENDIPMVSNRDGYLRVFVVANEANQALPSVRVRMFRNGSPVQTFTIPAPGPSTPTARDEGRLESSWNVKIPRSLIGAGMALVAEVDPTDAIAEGNETDNTFPLSGTPEEPQVRSVPVFGIRFVPVRQRANGLTGDVSDENRGSYLELTRKLYPLAGADGDVHAIYTTDTDLPLQAFNENLAWDTILGELNVLRIVEGTSRHYYGVVRIGYSSGVAGVGYIGLPAALGYDNPFDRARVMAHELGHNWLRDHSPCGGPLDVDSLYPYPGGEIGVYGIDMAAELLKHPTLPDIMGYCGNPWTSDYTYRGVLDFRSGSGAVAATTAREQRSLLVWGRIVNGRPTLEPAFEVVTRPSLPSRPGPYAVEGIATDGASLFSLSFDAARVADVPGDVRHFAFAVPLGDAAAARLGSIRLAAPAAQVATARPTPLAALVAPDSVTARRGGRGVAVRWNAAAHPMVMVRDPRTGEVLSFGRRGEVEVSGDRPDLEVLVSDGVGSRRLVVPVR